MGGCESVPSDDEDNAYIIQNQRRRQGCCDEVDSDDEVENNFIQSTRDTICNPPYIITQPPIINPPSVVNPPIRRVLDIYELLSETENIDATSAKSIIQLFESQNTIPFICRYRRGLIGNIKPDKLRGIKNSYTNIVFLRKKAETFIDDLKKEIEVNETIREHILSAKTHKELELIIAIYKPCSNRKTYHEAFESFANDLLIRGTTLVQLENMIDYLDPCYDTFDKIKNLVCDIISEKWSTHPKVLARLCLLQKTHKIVLKCRKAEKPNESVNSTTATSSAEGERDDQLKYEAYFKFENDVNYVKPHQMLSIKRGEKFKFLTVELIITNNFKNSIRKYINELYSNMCTGKDLEMKNEIFNKSFEMCYNNNLLRVVHRQVYANLTEKAKKAALENFSSNLRQLLLMPPLKGEPILGIDPGFTNGCKLAMISKTADVLEVGEVYPHKEGHDQRECGIQLSNMLKRNCCKRVALGNGIGCRETEAWLEKLFDEQILDRKNIQYYIVSEQGASVYSCSDVARKEFPELDVLFISAVSIARRLNDPLSEFVKINPRHLGIGMYQHDINQKLLSKTLNEVICECVSYVGVDINTASACLLKHIAGLNDKRAENIIQYRQRNGPFRSRKDLLRVKTIGEKAFLQCAGFIRIEPKTIGGKVANMLDCTWIHPESYEVANRIIRLCKLDVNNIGKPQFICKIKNIAETHSIEELSSGINIPSERLQDVLSALQRELFQDYRSDKLSQIQPIFKKDITHITDLFIGKVVTGEVRNVVDFGAFVDIGLECDGLIHKTKMNDIKLSLGDRVSALVIDLDIPKKHIMLRFCERF